MTTYELRVDGKALSYFSHISDKQIKEWLEKCAEHPDEQVEIVKIIEDVVMCQYEYDLYKRHFKNKQ